MVVGVVIIPGGGKDNPSKMRLYAQKEVTGTMIKAIVVDGG